MNELIVFAKAPRPGFVKTRLASDLGPVAACAAYRTLLGQLATALQSLSNVTVQFSPSDSLAELEPFFPRHWRFAGQAEGDLGNRMWNALRDARDRGITRPVIIGSDCPYVTTDDIKAAWAALETSDAVFGPAGDGGYWLVGACQASPELFNGMEWGSSNVLQQNLDRCRSLGLTIALLRTLNDIDTLADWEQFQSLHTVRTLRLFA